MFLVLRTLLVFFLLFNLATIGYAQPGEPGEKLRVVTKPFEPFVIPQDDNKYAGFSIDLWKAIAAEMDVEYELYGVDTLTDFFDAVQRGEANIGIAGISMTAEREERFDFSFSFFESGLQIMVLEQSNAPLSAVLSELLSPKLLYPLGILLLVLLIAAHIIWLVERRHNSDFSKGYFHGIGDGLWWSAVTVTTVGYGDKTPRGFLGRLFGLFWIFLGLFIIASFTATVTTTLTLNQLQGTINGPGDLLGKRVATVQNSTADQYLSDLHLNVVGYGDIYKAYRALELGGVEAVVYDAPVLKYYETHKGKGKVKTVGFRFKKENYGIVLPADSPHKEKINKALLKLKENGVRDDIEKKWFGS